MDMASRARTTSYVHRLHDPQEPETGLMLFCPRCDAFKAQYHGEAVTGSLDLHICEACGFKFEEAKIHVSPHILRNYAPPEAEGAEDEVGEERGGRADTNNGLNSAGDGTFAGGPDAAAQL